jgi:hypothetical protein
MNESPYSPELTEMPPRIKKLPVARGYPVPWFVPWVNGEPEFRAAEAGKFKRAIRDRLCWVCGEPLGRNMTFVIGPMCGINRTTAEPPNHHDCAAWSVVNCPFLSRPHAHRREGIEGGVPPAGEMLTRNPGVSLLWSTRGYELFGDGKGGVLIQIGEPISLSFWAEGKPALRAQVSESVESGLPLIMAAAVKQEGAVAELLKRKAWLEERYPKE